MTTKHEPSQQLLTTEQAAQFLNVSPATLETWRSTGAVAVPFCRIGKAVRYRLASLEDYLNENTATQNTDKRTA